jgi:hypothetical protein
MGSGADAWWAKRTRKVHDGAVAMPGRGPRIPITVRLAVDDYREVAVRARGRNWSLSDYIGWCVAQQLNPKAKQNASHTPTPYRAEFVPRGLPENDGRRRER